MFLKTDLRHFEFLDLKWNFSYFVLWHISWYPEKYLLTSRLMNSSLLCRGEDKQRGGTSFSKTVIRNDWTWALIEVLVLVTGSLIYIGSSTERELCVSLLFRALLFRSDWMQLLFCCSASLPTTPSRRVWPPSEVKKRLEFRSKTSTPSCPLKLIGWGWTTWKEGNCRNETETYGL